MNRAAPAWAAVALCAAAATAQEPQPPTPQFRTGVEVVRLDVSVLDRDRKPVRGLTAADFAVTVDGVSQPISAVSEIQAPDARARPDGWLGELASDVHTNALEHPRLFVLVLDDANVPWHPVFVDTTRKIAQAVVDRLGPNDRAAVVFTANSRHNVEFTSDRALLSAAIDRFTNIALPPCLRLTYSVRTLNEAVATLSAQPGARSSVIFVSVGPPAAATDESRPCYPGLGFLGDDAEAFLTAHLLSGSITSHVNNVRIYGISPAGLIAPGPALRGSVGAAGAELGNDFLRTVAAASGGRAVVNTNTPATAVPAILEENSTYYVVGYRPTYDLSAPGLRRVKVGVRTPDAIVLPSDRRIRTAAGPPAPASTTTGLAGIIPMTELPMRMALVAVPAPASPGRNEATVIVTIAVAGTKTTSAAAFEFEARLFDPEGKELVAHRAKAVPQVNSVRTESVLKFPVRTGRYNVRVSARDSASGRLGSVYGAIEVPDYRRAPLAMAAWLVNGGENPTSAREFSESEAPSAVLRVHQGDDGPVSAVTIRTRLLHGDGSIVHTRDVTIAAAEFDANRSSEIRYDLPITSLGVGPYLLRVDAESPRGAAVQHHIRFERRQ